MIIEMSIKVTKTGRIIVEYFFRNPIRQPWMIATTPENTK